MALKWWAGHGRGAARGGRGEDSEAERGRIEWQEDRKRDMAQAKTLS